MTATQPIVNKTMNKWEWGLLFLLSFLWSGSFLFGKVAVQELHPFTIVFGRVAIAAIVLYLVAVIRGYRIPTSPSLWGAFFIMGAFNNVIPFSLIFWGQIHISTGVAAILNATTPLFSIIVTHFLVQEEKMTANRVIGVLLGISGLAFMIGREALAGASMHVVAECAVLGAALSYTMAGIFGKRFKSLPPLVTATGQVTASSLILLPVMFMLEKPWTVETISMTTIGAVLALAVFSTAFAYIIYFRLLATAGVTNVMLVTLLVPAGALLLGMLVLGERLDPRHFVGMAAIGLGLLSVDGRMGRYLKRRLTIVPFKKEEI